LAGIRTFIHQDSSHYASVVVASLVASVDRLQHFPESGRAVLEFDDPSVRELIKPPYRIVYRLVGQDTIHILTIHHSAKRFPVDL
jgi:toxin ParE1/3/4